MNIPLYYYEMCTLFLDSHNGYRALQFYILQRDV